MYKALVIGCGNIGAMYDLKNSKIHTHVKAYAGNKAFSLWVYDENKKKAKTIARKYKTGVLEKLDEEQLKQFQFVSICTPTDTHFGYLETLIRLHIPLIICEKPICYRKTELDLLEKLYNRNTSKIIVNYPRRFLPSYHKIKRYITPELKGKKPKHIIIKYRRGFLNNASHAFDTLAFLFDWKTKIKRFKTTDRINDAFTNDATLTGHLLLNDVSTHLTGLNDIAGPVFEIEIYFEEEKILFRNSGDLVEFYDSKSFTKPRKVWNNALEDYMAPVIETAIGVYRNKQQNNFLSALELNRTLINLI